MEVVITKGIVTGFVSKTNNVATKRGIRQGSTLRDVLDNYGDSSMKFSYDESVLYEYRFASLDNKSCLLRIAIKNDRVEYISGRLE